MLNYCADFETTSHSQYIKDGYTRVYMYSIADIDTGEIINDGTDISSFFSFLTTTRRDRHINCYFHNLKFDGSFILFHIMSELGYKQVNKRKLEDKEYSALITDNGIWYSIKMCIKKANYKIYITFLDSFKKIPLSIANIGKAYKLNVFKGDLDYDKYIPKDYVPTKEDWDYIHRDVIIAAKALKIHLDEGLKKMTLSSDAFNDFKSMFTKRQFEYLFPELPNEQWEDIRKAYRGGWVYCNEKYTNKQLNNVLCFDVNSLYPYAMYTDFKLPYGKPVLYTGKYKHDSYYDLYIQTIDVSFDLKDGYLPTLQTSSLGMFAKEQFLTSSKNEIIELSLTNIDLEIFLKHHNINYIKYKYGYKFMSSNLIFKEYVDKWYAIKKEAEGGRREIAKKMLNSLYGKFGTSPKKRDKIVSIENDILKFANGEEYEGKYKYYIPVAVFITANARSVTINASQKLYKYHVYSDTDSIKVYGTSLDEVKKIINVDNKELGAFKYEARYKYSKFIRAKSYAYILGEDFIKKDEDMGLHVVCSGMTDKVKEDVEDIEMFKVGFKSGKKLQQIQVKGGCVLKPITYELKEQ